MSERAGSGRRAVTGGSAGSGVSPRRRGMVAWGDPRGRRMGQYAFILNRITGLGVLLYLFIHMMVLSLLARGPSAWDGFVDIALSPFFLSLDVLLIAGLLIHGLNGIRVTLVGFGLVYNRQKAMFASLMVLGVVALVIAAVRIFGAG